MEQIKPVDPKQDWASEFTGGSSARVRNSAVVLDAHGWAPLWPYSLCTPAVLLTSLAVMLRFLDNAAANSGFGGRV